MCRGFHQRLTQRLQAASMTPEQIQEAARVAAAAHASQAGRHVFHPIACLCGLAACQKMAMGRLHCVLHYTPYECFHQSVNQQCWLHWKCCVIAARRTHAVVYRSSSLQPVPGPGWSLHTASIIAVRLTMSLQCLCSAPPPRADYAPTTAADAPEPAAAAAPSVPAGPVSAEPMGPVAAAPPVRPCCHFLRLQLQAAGVQSLAGPQAAVPSTQDHPSTATRQLKCTCRAPRRAWKQCCRTQT